MPAGPPRQRPALAPLADGRRPAAAAALSAAFVASAAELLAPHGAATYREVLRVPALSLGLFVAAPGHDDGQAPHEVDEVDVVVAGRAALDGVPTPVQAGSVAHVPPHVPHRFVDVTEDLRVVVVFAPPGPD